MSAELGSQHLVQRLEKLERQGLILKCACVGLTLLSVGALVVGQAAPSSRRIVADEINARAVVIRDEAGRMRGWLGTAMEGTRLVVFDESGQQKAGFGLTANNLPAMALFQATDKPMMVLGVEPGNWPSILLYDMAGHRRAALSAQDDWSSIFFFDKNEKRRAGIGYVESGGAVNLFDDQGRARAGLAVGADASSLVFLDELGQKRIGLGTDQKSEALLGMFDAQGRTRTALALTAKGPSMSLHSTNSLMSADMHVWTGGANLKATDGSGKIEWQAVPDRD